jgi:phosphoglucomutase
MDPSLQALVAEWLRLDRDEHTRAEIQFLVDNSKWAELDARMRPRIRFGTAGLRAQMAAGFARMNPLTVLQTSQGLAAYLLSTAEDQVRPPLSAYWPRTNLARRTTRTSRRAASSLDSTAGTTRGTTPPSPPPR